MLEPKIEIHHHQLIDNARLIKQRLDKKTKIMAVVKSDAYGHGMASVSKTLNPYVDMFGVGFIEEGLKLKPNVTKDIFVLGPSYNFDLYVEHGFIASIESVHQFRALLCFYDNTLKDTDKVIRIHLKLDTGMHRFGMSFEELKEMMNIYDNKKCTNIVIEGMFSHFGDTYLNNPKKVEEQYALFVKAKEYIIHHYSYPMIFHIANSENALDTDKYNEDMVRIGNGLYGPLALKNPIETKKIARVFLPIVSIHVVNKKSKFGYGFRRMAKKGARLGAVKTGFYEGTGMQKMPLGQGTFSVLKFFIKLMIKALVRKDNVYYGAMSLPIVGTVNMQFFQVDLTGTDIMVGDFVEMVKAPMYFKESVQRIHVMEEYR